MTGGNPGAAGAGGMLSSPKGNTDIRYISGIGTKSNNQAKALALLKGCQLALLLGYREIIIFGDSMVLISIIIHGHTLRNGNLNSYLERIQILIPKFGYIKFVHILRNLNAEAEKTANHGVTLPIGSLKTTLWGQEMHPFP